MDVHTRANWTLSPPAADASTEHAAEQPDLCLHEVSKKFGNVIALDKASLTLRKGSIHALLGENGAGKTTLMRIAFGLIRPDSGSIDVKGKRVDFASPAQAIASGIGMVHQQFSLVPEMTVAENVALGGRGRYDAKTTARRIEAISNRIGMQLDPFAKVKTLTSSQRQKLEIVRTFAHDASILILDEPTAVLTPRDIGDLFAQLRKFAAEGGSVILITHKLRDAIDNADDVTVLRRGKCVLASPMQLVDQGTLALAMLGSSTVTPPSAPRPATNLSRVVVKFDDVFFEDERRVARLENASLQVAAGEIVGVAALEGAASQMLGLMAGRLQPTSGTIKLPTAIGFVPEDRSEEAVIPAQTLIENTALANAGARSRMIDWHNVRTQTTHIIADFSVRASGPTAAMSELSGGNQQKFVLGRELKDHPALLVLENPTQGLDVHAANAIHEKIKAAANDGTAIVIYSSDLDELAALSDRVLVVSRGRIAAARPDKESIGSLLLETAD